MPERISYTVAGNGKPIVLVHGLAGSRRWWRHQIPWLEGQAQVWTLELPGFGASARHRPLSITEAADVLTEFLRRHDLERPVLVGHSMGAHIGLHVASRKELRGLALVSASALVSNRVPQLMLELPRLALAGERRFVPTVVLDGLQSGLPNLWRAASYVVSDDPMGILSRVTCPTLLLWGERDTWVTKTMGEKLLTGLPGARLEVISGAAHVPMVDRPEAFDALLKDWLETLD
jgi:pimeloyl-ACP methyl ester carboxylesterase